jgi:hypothetical protein
MISRAFAVEIKTTSTEVGSRHKALSKIANEKIVNPQRTSQTSVGEDSFEIFMIAPPNKALEK